MIRQLALAALAAIVVSWPAGVDSRLGLERLSEPRAGALLVARRGLPDANFARTVVLLVHHDADGSVGVIINRRTELTLGEVLPDFEAGPGRELYFGGPVFPGRLTYLGRSDPIPEALFVVDGVFFGGQSEVLRELLGRSQESTELLLFAGHSGWGPGQLDAELRRADWHVVTLDGEMVFTTAPEALWHAIIDRLDPRDIVESISPDSGNSAGPPIATIAIDRQRWQ